MPSYDAIVIGGGTNGLAAAGRLAKAGRGVVVLECGREAGGGAASHEFAPGYRVSAVAHLLNVLDPRVEQGLDLARHGLAYAARGLATTALSASGDHLLLAGPFGARIEGSLADADRTAWAALRAKLLRFAAVLRPFKDMTPPRLAAGAGNEVWRLARLGLKVRGLGRADLRELSRMFLINIADVLDDELADERLKGVVAFDTVLGAHLGPRSPNSLLLLLNRLAGEAAGETAGLALPTGGMGTVARAFVMAAGAHGVEVRVGAKVAAVTLTGDRVSGVRLAGGEELRAPVVVAAVNPKTALIDLVGPRHLDTGFLRRARNIRMRGTAAKLHLALSGAPDFRGADLRTRLVIAPSLGAVEAAFDPSKYGRFSDQPVMEIVTLSAFGDGQAPPGHHVLSAIVHYAPYALEGGWEAGRAPFQARIMARLEEHAPGIGRLVTASELLTPLDLERQFGFIGGNWHHGELAAERMLFLRPMIGAAQYETPIPGLYLAGAGSHPGGGISGAAGWNAAERILATADRR